MLGNLSYTYYVNNHTNHTMHGDGNFFVKANIMCLIIICLSKIYLCGSTAWSYHFSSSKSM
jgi:hypothetical protein